jgi:hypothetical protein
MAMTMWGWLLVFLGLIVVIMGILGFLNKPIEFTPKEPGWHAAIKVIVGLIIIYIGFIV